MQIKKIILFFLIVFLISGCNTNTTEEPDNTETVESIYIDPITEGNPVEELGEDIRTKLSNYFGEPKDVFNAENLSLIGKTIDIFDLKVLDVNGKEVNLNKYKDTKVLIEIAATYCSHCGDQLKYLPAIRECIDDDIDILQIFADKNGDTENIVMFYANNNRTMSDKEIIIQYNYDLVDKIVSLGITQTPTFLFIDKGVIKTALSSFSAKFLKQICDVGFTNLIQRSEIVNDKGEPIEKFYRTYHTVMNEIKPMYKDVLNTFHESNMYLIGNNAGQYFNWYDLTSNYDDGYIKKESFAEYDGKDTIIFGLSNENEIELAKEIEFINNFIKDNQDIECLIVFLDDVEFYDFNTSNVYFKSDVKANCGVVSSRSSVPYLIDDIAYDFVYGGNVPMLLFVENNYVTGMCVGQESFNNLSTLKDMFFGDHCITLAKNLNRNY